MDDKTPIYLVSIVAVIALISIIVIASNMSSPKINPINDNTNTANGLTANVAANSFSSVHVNSGAVLRILLVAFMVGIFAFLYYKEEY